MIPFESKSAVLTKPWTYISKATHDAIAIPTNMAAASNISSSPLTPAPTPRSSPLLSTRRNHRFVRRWMSIFGF